MLKSSDRILTSHAGSLPRPDDLIEAWRAANERALAEKLTASVADVVRRQKEIGIDVPGDGEFGKPMAQRVNVHGGDTRGTASAGSIHMAPACMRWSPGAPRRATSC